MKKSQIPVSFIFILLFVSSCGPSEAEIATSKALTQEVVEQQTREVLATVEARRATDESMSTFVAVQTLQAATATKAIEISATAVAEKTAAEEATIRSATAIASPLYRQVRELESSGVISHTDGTYYALPDFSQVGGEWVFGVFAAGKETWLNTGFSPTNFVIRFDIHREEPVEEFISVCEIVFREQGESNYYIATFWILIDEWISGILRAYQDQELLGLNSRGKDLDSNETVLQFMLVVEDSFFYVYINGEEQYRSYDMVNTSGDLILAGQPCRMNSIELWIMD